VSIVRQIKSLLFAVAAVLMGSIASKRFTRRKEGTCAKFSL
jgi:hypothetical protein